MDTLISLRDFLWGIIKRCYWVIPSLLTDPFDIAERLGMTCPVPSYLFWLLFGLGIFVAAFLTYHDMRRKNRELNKQVVTQEWEHVRKKRIELINTERYPTEIPLILCRMEQRFPVLLDKATQQKVTKAQLDMFFRNLPHELLGMMLKGYGDEIITLFKFQTYMEAANIGFAEIKQNDAEWNTLTTELDDVKKDIPDQELKNHIRDYVLTLNGVYSWRLWGHYLDKTNIPIPKDVATARQANISRQYLLEDIFTRIKKRIDELRSGEEPKWIRK